MIFVNRACTRTDVSSTCGPEYDWLERVLSVICGGDTDMSNSFIIIFCLKTSNLI